jgi:AGZA family xanthine/uracil permease-like MFS transporter
VPKGANVTKQRASWAGPGDVNAFFGLMLDNVADLLLTVGLLSIVFDFPTIFALRYMVPGTAIGVLVGDLLFFLMALRLAKKTGRSDITAMPLGLDTPSTFGMVFFVLGPSYLYALNQLNLESMEAAAYTWRIGICSIVVSGLFKLACAAGSAWIRRVVPRAGLLGSLAAIALVLISFLPLLEILHFPVAGMTVLAIIMMTLIARIPTPGRVPGALAALIVGAVIFYSMQWLGLLHFDRETMGGISTGDAASALLPYEWLQVFQFQWLTALKDSLQYMPVVLPFALATVIGGIDCTESAAAAGDEYPTNQVIAGEAIATLAAGLCGGVIQTTPYIGHPAYKAMGGRAGYVLWTALFVGSAGLIGYFGFLYLIVPKPTVFPILIFIGLEITAQSFRATPKRHYAAVALACVPALAFLALSFVDRLFGDGALVAAGITSANLENPLLRSDIKTLRILSNGFIITSLLWSSQLAAIIDRRLLAAAGFFLIAAVATLFGIVHSPFGNGAMYVPWMAAEKFANETEATYRYTAAYLVCAAVIVLWSFLVRDEISSQSHDYMEHDQ